MRTAPKAASRARQHIHEEKSFLPETTSCTTSIGGPAAGLEAAYQGVAIGVVFWLLRRLYFAVRKIQGLGFGERLFEACRYQLDTRQMCGLIVWALADNTTAADFYWRRGGRPVGVGFERFGPRKLKKIAAGGGPIQSLCNAADGRGGSWSREDVIVFSPSVTGVAIQRVMAAGGVPIRLLRGNDGLCQASL